MLHISESAIMLRVDGRAEMIRATTKDARIGGFHFFPIALKNPRYSPLVPFPSSAGLCSLRP